MDAKLTILLYVLLIQCDGILSEGSFVKISITNTQLNGRVIREHELPSVVQRVDGFLFILVHDYVKQETIDWYNPLTYALLTNQPDSSVLQFHWVFKRKSLWPTNVKDINVLAQDMVILLNTITDKFPGRKIVLIGHGLGALICGVAARLYHSINGKWLGRIIALDPKEIGGTFETKLKITKTDAFVVMVIHTVSSHDRGKSDGSIEFFPNGGQSQPGCSLLSRCGNRRSYEYFISAVINPEKYMAKGCSSYKAFKKNSCDSLESMGNLETIQEGFFYLDTDVD